MSLRWLFAVCLIPLSIVGSGASSGCFNPRVKNLGFACSTTDPTPCPNGYLCINGLCDDGSGGARAVVMDLSQPPAATDDLSRAPAPADLARPIATDLARPPVADMTLPVVDMTPTCVAKNGACTHSSDCCSGHCHTFTTLVCF